MLDVGVLGHGLRANLADIVHQAPGAQIVAVCDPDPTVAASIPQRYGADVTVVDSLDALLQVPLDAVLVLTPDHLHEQHAVALLEAGLPVYLEKPMATSIDGCDRILHTATRTGTPLYVGHNMRHMPFVRTMKRLIDEGAIGEPKTAWCRHFVGHGGDFYFRDWHADQRHTHGLLLQKGAHDIDVLHWLMRGYSSQVTAMGELAVYGDVADAATGTAPAAWWRDPEPLSTWPPSALPTVNPVVDVEDISMLLMRLDNHTLCSYQQCHFTPDYWRNYTVIGTEGRLENAGDGAEGTVIRVWNQRARGYHPDGDRVIEVPTESGGHGGSDERVITEFLAFARDGGPVETSPVAARYAVAAACAGTESLRSGGRAVPVPPADEAAPSPRPPTAP